MIEIEKLLLGVYTYNYTYTYIPSKFIKIVDKISRTPRVVKLNYGDFCFLMRANSHYYYTLPINYFLENPTLDIFFDNNRVYRLLPKFYKGNFQILK
jgi:hypothetical protein